jgi:hypothetical protein
MEAGLGCDEYNKQDLVLKIVPFEPCLVGIVLHKALIFVLIKMYRNSSFLPWDHAFLV